MGRIKRMVSRVFRNDLKCAQAGALQVLGGIATPDEARSRLLGLPPLPCGAGKRVLTAHDLSEGVHEYTASRAAMS